MWFVCVSEAFTSSTPAVKFWFQAEFEEKIIGDINYLINKTALSFFKYGREGKASVLIASTLRKYIELGANYTVQKKHENMKKRDVIHGLLCVFFGDKTSFHIALHYNFGWALESVGIMGFFFLRSFSFHPRDSEMLSDCLLVSRISFPFTRKIFVAYLLSPP